ncbi:MAG: hypothetical protein ABIH89_09510 [Elusimicrobiota bacterium]
MADDKNKKKIKGFPGPPPPLSIVRKGGAPPPPPPAGIKIPEIKKIVREEHTPEFQDFEARLQKDREELLERIREKEGDNIKLQEQFLQKEREETERRQKELDKLRNKLETEYLEREDELSSEKEKWKKAIDELRQENQHRLALEKTQNQIREQARTEAQQQVYEQMKELKKQLEAAKKIAYEERIRYQEEEKNTIKVEQALKDVIQGVSRNRKLEDAESEKEELAHRLREYEEELVRNKFNWEKKFQESEGLRDNLRLDYQNRLKETKLKFENSLLELQSSNTRLNGQIWQLQNKFDNKREIWEERIRDKINENEKLVTQFRGKLSELKYEYVQKVTGTEQKKESVLKDYLNISKIHEEKQMELTTRINSLIKDKDLIEKEYTVKLSALDDKLKDREREFSADKKVYEHKLAAMEAKLVSETARWQAKIDNLESANRTRMKEIEKEYDLKISDYSSKAEKVSSEKDTLNEEYAVLKREYSIFRDSMESEKRQAEDGYNTSERRFETEKKEIQEAFIRKLQELKINYDTQKEKLENIAEEKNTLEKESMVRIRAIMEKLDELKLANRNLALRIKDQDAASGNYESMIAGLKAKNSELSDRLLKSGSRLVELENSYKIQINKSRAESSSGMQELEDKHSGEMEILRKKADDVKQEMLLLRQEKDSRLAQMESDFESYKRNFKWMKQEWLEQKEELDNDHRKKEKGLNARIAVLEKELEDSAERADNDTSRYEAAIDNLNEKHCREIDRYTSRIEALTSGYEKEKDKLTVKVAGQTEEIVSLKKLYKESALEYETKISSTGRIMENLEKEKSALENSIKAAIDEADIWRGKYTEQSKLFEDAKTGFRKQAEELEERTKKLKNKYEGILQAASLDWENKREKLEKRAGLLAREKQVIEEEKTVLALELEEKTSQCTGMETRLESIESEKAEAAEKIAANSIEIKKLRETVEAINADKEIRVSGLNDLLEEKESMLSGHLQRASEYEILLAETREKIREKNKENLELLDIIEEKNSALTEAESVMESSITEKEAAFAEKLGMLREKLKEKEHEVNVLKKGFRDKETEIRNYTSSVIDELNDKKETVSVKLKETREVIRRVEDENRRLNGLLEEKDRMLKEREEKFHKEVSDREEDLVFKLKKLKEALDEEKLKNEGLRSSITKKDITISELESILEAGSSDIVPVEISAEIEHLKAQLTQKEKEIAETEAKYREQDISMSGRIQVLEKELEKKESDIKDTESRHAGEIRDALSEITGRLKSRETELLQKETENSELKKEIELTLKTADKQGSEGEAVKTLEKENNRLQQILGDTEAAVNGLRERLKGLETKLSQQNDISEELDIKENIIIAGEKKCEDLRIQVGEREEVLIELEERLIEAQKENEQQAKLLEAAGRSREMIDEVDVQNTELWSKLEEKDKIISDLKESVSRLVSPEELAGKEEEIKALKAMGSLKKDMKEIEDAAGSRYTEEAARKEKIISGLKKELEEAAGKLEDKKIAAAELETKLKSAGQVPDGEKLQKLETENSGLKDKVGELEKRLKDSVLKLKKVMEAGQKPGPDTGEIDIKWKKKWEKREKEIQDFVGKAQKSAEENKILKGKLETAMQDERTLSELAATEKRKRQELAVKHAELIQALEETKKPFLRKLIDKLTGSKKIVLL